MTPFQLTEAGSLRDMLPGRRIQGGQFTSIALAGRLPAAGIQVSMGGSGPCMGNIPPFTRRRRL